MPAEDDTIDALNDLIEVCKDGEYGFRLSAENLGSNELANIFVGRAERCRLAALELRAVVEQLGGTAEAGGTTAGALLRSWLNLKAALAGFTDDEILEATQRAEGAALVRYRQALQRSLTPTARAVVQQQFAGVQHNDDLVQALRARTRMALA